MKRTAFIWIVFCIVLCVCCAFAEDYSGVWVASSYSDTNGLHQPVLQYLSYVPSIDLKEDHLAKIILGDLETDGVWELTDDGRIAVYSVLADDLFLEPGKDYEQFLSASSPDDGISSFVFRRLDEHSPVGAWSGFFATNGIGNGWYADDDSTKILLNEDGTAEFSYTYNGESIEHASGVWGREGNDVVFSISAKDEEGNDISVPYMYFWMNDGLLYYSSLREEQGGILWICMNTANVKETDSVGDYSLLSGTSWDLCGIEMKGCMIPFAITGEDREGTFTFNADGTCIYSVTDQADHFNVEIDDGKISFIYPGMGVVYKAVLTKDGYLKLLIKNRSSLFYRKK